MSWGAGRSESWITVENESLRAVIDPLGAELQSLRRSDDSLEYMWSGDARHWSRRAPHLFPIVGRLRDDSFVYRGQLYRLPQHGFARDRIFAVVESGPKRARFELRDDVETRAVFPFAFRLEVAFRPTGAELEIAYQIDNPGAVDLLFSIGGHPGFRCPLTDEERFDDYELVFEQREHAVRSVVEEGLIGDRTELVLDDASILPLWGELFYRGALVFKELRSRSVLFRGRGSGRGVELRFEGFEYFGIWSRPGAPLLCLEPWCGIADSIRATGRLENKAGIIRLPPRQRFSVRYFLRPF